MGVVVKKYGGTSVGSTERIKNVASQIIKAREKETEIVVIVSAMSGETDRLIALGRQICKMPDEREMDMLVSTGEQVSSALLSMALIDLGCPTVSLNAPQIEILTDKSHTKAKICKINTDRIIKELTKGKVVIVAGFQGITEDEDITTLGRGGSDTTAVAIAGALQADVCEIFTDVDGVYTADPRIVPEARKLDVISYEEMLEMASLGAKVLHSRSVELAKKFGVKIHVLSSFVDVHGTIVTEEGAGMEELLVSGVTANAKEAKITVIDIPDKPGMAGRLFSALADANINVDMIVQSETRGKTNDISFTVDKTDLQKAIAVTKESVEIIGAGSVVYDQDIAKVSIVGVGMKSHSGVASLMFKALAEHNINIEMISTS
ncbi:MAG: aspartate kinase, partial [Candidatus Desantisbacteria bacterium]